MITQIEYVNVFLLFESTNFSSCQSLFNLSLGGPGIEMSCFQWTQIVMFHLKT
jgi:hypothetical protein